MKKVLVILVPVLVILISWQQPPQGLPPAPEPAPNPDSLAKERAKYVEAVMASIKGKENMRADSVFQNLKIFNKMPAERVIRIMDGGWSRSLGVNCNHCHDTNHWEAETKLEKQIARDMAAMTGKINDDMLKNIKNLETKTRIGCNTCHQGKAQFGPQPARR
jgi:hypothetical protein